jgi:hypothetical protein
LVILKFSSNLATVKRLSLILILLFGLIFTSFAQIKTSGSGDEEAKYLKFYPNPATTTIAFEFVSDFDKSYSIQIYNFMGKKVYELKATSQTVTLPLDDFFRGMYIYQLRDGNGTIVESGKFQVVK